MQKAIFLTIGIFIFIVLFLLYKTQLLTGKNNIRNSKVTVLAKATKPITDKQDILGETTSAEKTYTSPEGKYTITYPGSWTPDEMEQTTELSGNTPIFTIGPVGKKVLGYPSFIQIGVDDNVKGLSLNDFLSQHFDQSVTFTPFTIASVSGEKTQNIQGTVPNDTYFMQNNTKIYRIRWFHGAEPSISTNDFQKVMSSFTFQ